MVDLAAPARPRRHSLLRRLGVIAAALAALLLAVGLVLTDANPSVPEPPEPTAEQVGAARAAALQLRLLRAAPAGTSVVRFTPEELAGAATLASHGFAPDRLRVTPGAGGLTIAGSHRLPLGRWLNMTLTAAAGQPGFPPARLAIGPLTLGERPTRLLFRAARVVLGRRGVALPPLDRLVSGLAVDAGGVSAVVDVPPKLFEQLAGLKEAAVDAAATARIYCGLAAAQRRVPEPDFAAQVRRAFAFTPAASVTPAQNRATFVALAMLLVDERAGELAGDARARTAACRVPVPDVTIHGRADLPKHWTLSAALQAGAGTQIAQAMGAWKELADSLERRSAFAVGDPTGFSFLDLAADRSGFRAAQAATDPATAVATAASLARATPAQLLPPSLMRQPDGLSNQQFVRHYGGLSDARYDAAVARIDAVLDAEGLR